MLVFTLFALINLCIGYAVAVLLGHGPSPWYAIFLPAPGSDVVQIDALEAEAAHPSDEADDEPVAEAPATVNYPFPEMNEPEDQQAEGKASAEEEAELEQDPQLDLPDERPAQADEDDDDDIEKFLAAGKTEPAPQDDESLTGDELASMFATQDAFEEMEAAAEDAAIEDEPAPEDEPEPEDEPAANADDGAPEEEENEASLDQDDIAALFNQV